MKILKIFLFLIIHFFTFIHNLYARSSDALLCHKWVDVPKRLFLGMRQGEPEGARESERDSEGNDEIFSFALFELTGGWIRRWRKTRRRKIQVLKDEEKMKYFFSLFFRLLLFFSSPAHVEMSNKMQRRWTERANNMWKTIEGSFHVFFIFLQRRISSSSIISHPCVREISKFSSILLSRSLSFWFLLLSAIFGESVRRVRRRRYEKQGGFSQNFQYSTRLRLSSLSKIR